MESAADDPRFQEGIRCFNRRAFFEAHEVWEDIWRDDHGASRHFYQGLIQVAVCLHHFRNGNTRGARKLCITGSNYLEPYRPACLGIDLERLLRDLHACCDELLASDEAIPQAKLDLERIPSILASDHAGTNHGAPG
jgi:hypothetical protein